MPGRRIAKITASYLEHVTTWYLERHATSTAHLRSLLLQRVRRSAEAHGTDPAEGQALVEAELERLERLGLLNDARYAEDKARSLRRRGASTRKVRATLQEKGVAEAPASEEADPDWLAARVWARRRRIGPWRTGPVDAEVRKKELAKLARAGFSFDVARRVVDSEDQED